MADANKGVRHDEILIENGKIKVNQIDENGRVVKTLEGESATAYGSVDNETGEIHLTKTATAANNEIYISNTNALVIAEENNATIIMGNNTNLYVGDNNQGTIQRRNGSDNTDVTVRHNKNVGKVDGKYVTIHNLDKECEPDLISADGLRLSSNDYEFFKEKEFSHVTTPVKNFGPIIPAVKDQSWHSSVQKQDRLETAPDHEEILIKNGEVTVQEKGKDGELLRELNPDEAKKRGYWYKDGEGIHLTEKATSVHSKVTIEDTKDLVIADGENKALITMDDNTSLEVKGSNEGTIKRKNLSCVTDVKANHNSENGYVDGRYLTIASLDEKCNPNHISGHKLRLSAEDYDKCQDKHIYFSSVQNPVENFGTSAPDIKDKGWHDKEEPQTQKAAPERAAPERAAPERAAQGAVKPPLGDGSPPPGDGKTDKQIKIVISNNSIEVYNGDQKLDCEEKEKFIKENIGVGTTYEGNKFYILKNGVPKDTQVIVGDDTIVRVSGSNRGSISLNNGSRLTITGNNLGDVKTKDECKASNKVVVFGTSPHHQIDAGNVSLGAAPRHNHKDKGPHNDNVYPSPPPDPCRAMDNG